MPQRLPSAASLRLMGCHACGQLARAPEETHGVTCPRCGAHLHFRKPNSINRTWALLIASMICYVPANLLPVMVTHGLFGTQSDTIMSGVVYMWVSGSWPLAVLIFFASIMVPMLKIIALIFLLISVQTHSGRRARERARLYRVVEFVGRWSMLDIFVVAILVALVQLQGLATIAPGGGVMAFASVVVLTMFAAMSFDPRLIWDNIPHEHHRKPS